MSFSATLGSALNTPPQNPTEHTSIQRNVRRRASSLCSTIKLLSIATLIASVAFAIFAIMAIDSLFLMALALSLTTLIGIVSYDAFVIASRAQKCLDGFVDDLRNQNLPTKYEKTAYLCSGTVLARPILQLALRENGLR